MAKNRFLLVIVLSVLTVCAAAQSETTEGKKPFNFMVKGGVSAVCEEDFYYYSTYGIGANVAGYVEMPMSKKNDRWKVSLGLKLNNKNLNGGNFDANMLFLDVPLLFSYDFYLRENTDLRLSFGLYYERYMSGKVRATEIAGGMRPSTDASGLVYLKHNGGLTVGLGFMFKDFYFGADMDVNYFYEDFMFVTSASVGYRF